MTDKAAKIAVERGKIQPTPVKGPSASLVRGMHAEQPKPLKNGSDVPKILIDAARRGS